GAARAVRDQRPEARSVLGAARVARRVVLVRQVEVVRELVREHADATVLRLDRVVADPVVRIADPHTAESVRAGPVRTVRGEVRVPPVRPDRIRALGAATRLLADAG